LPTCNSCAGPGTIGYAIGAISGKISRLTTGRRRLPADGRGGRGERRWLRRRELPGAVLQGCVSTTDNSCNSAICASRAADSGVDEPDQAFTGRWIDGERREGGPAGHYTPEPTMRALVFPLILILLTACNPFAPTAGFDYKECRHKLEQLPQYEQIRGLDRLRFIDQCMVAKGLRPSARCVGAQAQGKPHCEYERS
jgi:hypothetical protein